jgi:hypothetical protein
MAASCGGDHRLQHIVAVPNGAPQVHAFSDMPSADFFNSARVPDSAILKLERGAEQTGRLE